MSVSGLLLAVPPAVWRLAFFLNRAPLGLAVALAILPRVFGTLRALWNDFYRSGALLAARARGVAPWYWPGVMSFSPPPLSSLRSSA